MLTKGVKGESGLGPLFGSSNWPGFRAGRSSCAPCSPVHLDVEAGRERVDDRRADTVQTARCRVRATAELPAGVQLGEHDLDTAQTGLRLDVDGDATAVVVTVHGGVSVEDDADPRAVPASASSTELSMISTGSA